MKNISKNILFFRTDDEKSFNSYYLVEKKESSFENILIYNINKKVKEIDKKGKIALQSLKVLIYKKHSNQEEKIAYEALDTFVVASSAFRKHIHGMKATEIASLKRTVISSLVEKLYDNISKNRGVSSLRFALVLLKENIEKFDNNLLSHIFYDIQNGVNINREVEKNFINKFKESIWQKEIDINHKTSESFIKKYDERRFINSLLKSLLIMHNYNNCDIKKIAILVSYISYISSTDDIKITLRAGVEKIQISHSFMILIEYQIKYNCYRFILMLEEFFRTNHKDNIELFLKKRVSKDTSTLTIKGGTLRQKNLKFLNSLLVIGDFFSFISGERDIESIISSFQQKVLDKNIDITRCAKEDISSKFLKLFAKKYRKRDCEERLKDFLKSFRKNLYSSPSEKAPTEVNLS